MDDIVFFRIAERLTLTAVVLIIAVVVMVGFWRSVQKLDVEYTGGIGGTFVFTTPVFVLLAIIGYAWVSLEHPISVGGRAASAPDEKVVDAGASVSSAFLGSAQIFEADADLALAHAQQRIRSLNCLADGQDLSPLVQDDLATLKVALMTPVWNEAWGAQDAFGDWAMGVSQEAPNAEAREIFDALHVAC